MGIKFLIRYFDQSPGSHPKQKGLDKWNAYVRIVFFQRQRAFGQLSRADLHISYVASVKKHHVVAASWAVATQSHHELIGILPFAIFCYGR